MTFLHLHLLRELWFYVGFDPVLFAARSGKRVLKMTNSFSAFIPEVNIETW